MKPPRKRGLRTEKATWPPPRTGPHRTHGRHSDNFPTPVRFIDPRQGGTPLLFDRNKFEILRPTIVGGLVARESSERLLQSYVLVSSVGAFAITECRFPSRAGVPPPRRWQGQKTRPDQGASANLQFLDLRPTPRTCAGAGCVTSYCELPAGPDGHRRTCLRKRMRSLRPLVTAWLQFETRTRDRISFHFTAQTEPARHAGSPVINSAFQFRGWGNGRGGRKSRRRVREKPSRQADSGAGASVGQGTAGRSQEGDRKNAVRGARRVWEGPRNVHQFATSKAVGGGPGELASCGLPGAWNSAEVGHRAGDRLGLQTAAPESSSAVRRLPGHPLADLFGDGRTICGC